MPPWLKEVLLAVVANSRLCVLEMPGVPKVVPYSTPPLGVESIVQSISGVPVPDVHVVLVPPAGLLKFPFETTCARATAPPAKNTAQTITIPRNITTSLSLLVGDRLLGSTGGTSPSFERRACRRLPRPLPSRATASGHPGCPVRA